MKEVVSAPKCWGLKVIQRISWQEDKQEYFYKCKRNKDKRRYNAGLNIIKKAFLKGGADKIGALEVSANCCQIWHKQISLIK